MERELEPRTAPPPSSTFDPRRVGIMALGAYWGAAGEQIDTLSGNLNFTLPLVKAMGRNGWSANFGLSYNSQLWRQDLAATWKLGRDVGYGFGWRFQAGSLTPYWQDPWTIHHYLFVDSTGAEYRLGVHSPDGQVWSSQEGSGYKSYAFRAGAPGVITPDGNPSLSENATYTPWLGVATDTQPNSSTSSTSPPVNTATTNGHWTRTIMDGLGRTVRVTRPGYSGTILPLGPAGRSRTPSTG